MQSQIFLEEDMENIPNIEEGSFSNGKKIKDIEITAKEVEKSLKH